MLCRRKVLAGLCERAIDGVAVALAGFYHHKRRNTGAVEQLECGCSAYRVFGVIFNDDDCKANITLLRQQ
ncbi:hypothetical protein D3C87_2186470 [compost metagenome]